MNPSALVDVRELVRKALGAWPAIETARIGGWEVRFSGGFTKRANSVQPIGAAEAPLPQVIASCEGWYRERGRPCIFRLTPLVTPDLESHLEERGYRLIETTSVLSRPLGDLPEAPRFVEFDVKDWVTTYARLAGIDDEARESLGAILGRIRPSRVLGAIAPDGHKEPVACGMAVAERGWVGLFDLVTEAGHRRQGYGGRLVNGLLRWGHAEGARNAYLQVLRDNVAAWSLYWKLGFRPAYDYRYRARELGA